jgi:3',5'-cyclic AMP phosphodiesterase CpdA
MVLPFSTTLPACAVDLSFVHLSDLHFTHPRPRGNELGFKLALGLPAWFLRRRHLYQSAVLAVLEDELRRRRPDHVVITGDLTSLGTEAEYREAAAWLGHLGESDDITVVPGNHDATGRRSLVRGLPVWQSYTRSDACRSFAASVKDAPPVFPIVRIRGPAMIIGLSSATTTNPLLASGRLDARELMMLEDLLVAGAARGLFRIVLVHHPPHGGIVTHRKRLENGAVLLDVLRRRGAELVLHGHAHRLVNRELVAPGGCILLDGVPPAIAVDHRGDRRAAFTAYRLRVLPGAWELQRTVYRLVSRRDSFAEIFHAVRRLPRRPSSVTLSEQGHGKEEYHAGHKDGKRRRP